VATDHEGFDAGRDQRSPVSAVDHFAWGAQFLAKRGWLQGLQLDAGCLERGLIHFYRLGGFAFLTFGMVFAAFGMVGFPRLGVIGLGRFGPGFLHGFGIR